MVCSLPTDLEANESAELTISIKGVQQIAVSGSISILPMPRVEKMVPSGHSYGGQNVIIHGADFTSIDQPLCYFEDIVVTAHVLTNKTIACITPEMNLAGKKVKVQVTLDGGRTIHGDLAYSLFSPIILQDTYPRIVLNGTRLSLRGEGFISGLPIQCAFGETTFVPATVLSSTEAFCVFALTTKDFIGQVSISIASLDYIPISIGDIGVMHHPKVEISSRLPLYGSVVGGEVIELQVFGILDDIITKEDDLAPIYCHFGDKVALATLMLDEVRISCVTPAGSSTGNVSLSLSYHGVSLSINALPFEYTFEPKVFSLEPSSGPFTGGTSVRVHGLNLRSIVACRFGDYESYGYMDSASENTIICVTPAVSSVSSHQVFLRLDPSKDHWFDTKMSFDYVEPISIESIFPHEIDLSVEFVRVIGKGFSRALPLHCCFGEGIDCISSEATVLSNMTMQCPIPWEAVSHLGPLIPLSITQNGVDYIQLSSPLTYIGHEAIMITSLSPNLGPSFGGTYVDVYGSGFKANTKYSCWFGECCFPIGIHFN